MTGTDLLVAAPMAAAARSQLSNPPVLRSPPGYPPDTADSGQATPRGASTEWSRCPSGHLVLPPRASRQPAEVARARALGSQRRWPLDRGMRRSRWPTPPVQVVIRPAPSSVISSAPSSRGPDVDELLPEHLVGPCERGSAARVRPRTRRGGIPPAGHKPCRLRQEGPSVEPVSHERNEVDVSSVGRIGHVGTGRSGNRDVRDRLDARHRTDPTLLPRTVSQRIGTPSTSRSAMKRSA